MKYPESESATIEFKQQLPTKQQIIKTIVGFCNHFGGKLIIGVDDNNNICGVPESDIDSLIESLQQSIYQSCTPTILPSLYTQRIQEKLLVIIEVSSGMNKPYFLTSLGINEGTFIRSGAHTTKAPLNLIQDLIWRNKGFSADATFIYPAEITQIDESKFINFLEKNRSSYKNTPINTQLLNYKIINEEHSKLYPTLGGLLLFGKAPQNYVPEAFIICSHFEGVSGRKAIASLDCIGDLLNQVETAINFVKSRLNSQFQIKDIKREERLEIPEVALREVIINAIVHRDYNLPSPIKIAIYDNRLEVFSPGNFPGPLNVTQLEMGITYIRNHIICRVFREAGYIEKLGSGFLTLFKSYREYNLPAPEVKEGAGFIKCILPRESAATKNGKNEQNKESEQIMRLFYTTDEISVSDVTTTVNVSRQTATRRLNKLIEDKKIFRIGKGPAIKYKKC